MSVGDVGAAAAASKLSMREKLQLFRQHSRQSLSSSSNNENLNPQQSQQLQSTSNAHEQICKPLALETQPLAVSPVLVRRSSAASSSSSSSLSSSWASPIVSPSSPDDSYVTAFERPRHSSTDSSRTSTSLSHALRALKSARLSSLSGSLSGSGSASKDRDRDRERVRELEGQVRELEGQVRDLECQVEASRASEREAQERAQLSLEDVHTSSFVNSLLEQRVAELEGAMQSERLDRDELSSSCKKHKAEAKRLSVERDECEARGHEMFEEMQAQLAQLQAYALERMSKLEEELLAEQTRSGALESELAAMKGKEAQRGKASAASSAGVVTRGRGGAKRPPVKAKKEKEKEKEKEEEDEEEDEDGSDTEEEKDK